MKQSQAVVVHVHTEKPKPKRRRRTVKRPIGVAQQPQQPQQFQPTQHSSTFYMHPPQNVTRVLVDNPHIPERPAPTAADRDIQTAPPRSALSLPPSSSSSTSASSESSQRQLQSSSSSSSGSSSSRSIPMQLPSPSQSSSQPAAPAVNPFLHNTPPSRSSSASTAADGQLSYEERARRIFRDIDSTLDPRDVRAFNRFSAAMPPTQPDGAHAQERFRNAMDAPIQQHAQSYHERAARAMAQFNDIPEPRNEGAPAAPAPAVSSSSLHRPNAQGRVRAMDDLDLLPVRREPIVLRNRTTGEGAPTHYV